MSLLELFCAVDDVCKTVTEEQVGRLLLGAYHPPRSSVDPTTKCLGGYEVSQILYSQVSETLRAPKLRDY